MLLYSLCRLPDEYPDQSPDVHPDLPPDEYPDEHPIRVPVALVKYNPYELALDEHSSYGLC